MFNVLVVFERSGITRQAFRDKGVDAWSCDLFPAEDGSPFHLQEDGFRVAGQFWWDLVIAHPECTDIAVSGALRFKEKIADGRQQQSIENFMKIADLKVERLCIENPVSIMSTRWRKPDQIIQPYEFGHDASKKTCLWLKNLPPLVIDPAEYVQPRTVNGKKRWANQTDSGQNRLAPSEHRAMDRARTYSGIARAMADQWTTPVNIPLDT